MEERDPLWNMGPLGRERERERGGRKSKRIGEREGKGENIFFDTKL